MITKINRLIFLFAVVFICLYVVHFNRDPASLYLIGTTISAWSGILYIGIFCVGFITAGIVALYFGFKAYLRERQYQNRERQFQSFFDSVIAARGFMVTGEWQKARLEWEKIIKRDADNIIARTELSRSLELAGEPREALKILDAARSAAPSNIEVLFRAAELNLSLHNKTAAIDNLALVLYHHPNRRAAQLARELSEEVERFDDALEYNAQFTNLGGDEDLAREARIRIEFRKLLKEGDSDSTALEAGIRAFVKRYPDYVPALHHLAKIEDERGATDEAAQLLVRAGKLSSTPSYLEEAAELWIKRNLPDRAIGAARFATKGATGIARAQAELNLGRLYLKLNMLEEAKKLLAGFPMVVKSEGLEMDPELSHRYLALKGLCLSSLAEHNASHQVWKELNDFESEMASIRFGRPSAAIQAPSPTLSTP